MRHPEARRFADLAEGRLSVGERLAIEEHVAACPPCAAARARVLLARGTLGELAAAPPPSLPWEQIGARAYWEVQSDARRQRDPGKEPRRAWSRFVFPVALGGLAAAAIALFALRDGDEPSAPQGVVAVAPVAPVVPVAPVIAPVIAPVVAPAALEGVVVLAQSGAKVDGAALEPESAIVAGSRLASGGGRLAVQFGVGSGFLLEPESELIVVALDVAAVELRLVRGAVGVELTRRHDAQRFAVLAGERRVEVRGTLFQVALDDTRLTVAVSHGRVAVVGEDGAVELPAGNRVEIASGARLAKLLARPMGERDEQLLGDALAMPLSGAFADAATARAASGIARVDAAPRADVTMDGVRLGAGALWVRAAAGRHVVEVGGQRRRIELGAGETQAVQPARGGSERARQVAAELVRHRGLVEACAAKRRQLEPGFVGELVLEVVIEADGAIRSAYAVRGLPAREVETCVLDVVRDRFAFAPGEAGTVQHAIRF